ncbi:N-acetylglucosamine-6-phosphate deacetylase [Guptibacillus algicola]|uniref:N-acetylglucosamine-6-phosphate deacetylase n=1 Tax=Guptibacillus algicola TaxID=225844 RepID=UPI001CD406D4|nr:N-acetylglucosamine-6-phosphate deacetylase [Alkalihalobacillus algicola]MCA0988806.1 N-acetylglucosamine-6-phosphate deacetylase [Alkalihalobacillus algicola]
MNEDSFVIDHVRIYAEDETISNGYIRVRDGKIVDVGHSSTLTIDSDESVFPVSDSLSLLPGMIDVHIHGVSGADTMDATPEALDTITRTLPSEGTTSFLATTITNEAAAIEKALDNASDFLVNHQKPGNAEILGIHLEGPFINNVRAGAQPSDAIQEPNIDLFKKWNKLARETIKLVTLAPELDRGVEMVRYLSKKGIVASIGHSDATHEQVKLAVDNGATHVTHLYNGMRGLHHREPGVAGAALLFGELRAEIIADGYHVRPEMIDLAYRQKTDEGIVLITDSMRAKCLKNGSYDLGGQDVFVQDGKAVLDNGTLAGSVLKMNDALRNIQEFTGCSLESAIKMAAENPARQIGVYDRKGSIAVGKDADLILLDNQGEIFATFCKGVLSETK